MEPVDPNKSNVVPNDSVQKRYLDRTLGTLSMAIGVITLIIGFVPCINWLALVPGAIGLVIGIYALVLERKAHVGSKIAIWGIVFNVVGILGVIITNLWLNAYLFGNDHTSLL
jgi:membrane-bound ClpP family serine protease